MVSTSRSVTDSPQPVKDLAFTLGNLSDDILSGMDWDDFFKLVINARDTISVVPSSPIHSFAQSNLFSTPQFFPSKAPSTSLTPKIDRFRSIALLGDIMTYTSSLNLLDSQDSFDHIFGAEPYTPQKGKMRY